MTMQQKRLPGLMGGYADPHAANAPQPGNPHHANGPSAPGAPMSPTDLVWLQALQKNAPMVPGLAGGIAGMFGSGGNLGAAALGGMAGLGLGQLGLEYFDVPRMIDQRRARPVDNPDPMPTYSGKPF